MSGGIVTGNKLGRYRDKRLSFDSAHLSAVAEDDVINAGGKYVDREVVVDGNLITSRKPEDLPAFMKAIIKALA